LQQLKAWNRTDLRGDYLFDVQPDGAAKLDVGQRRKDLMDLYKIFRRDPMANPQWIMSQIAEVWGADLSEFMVQPQPDAPKPPAIRYSFKGEDLLNPITVAFLQKGGIEITPQDIQAAKALITDALGDVQMQQPMDGGAPADGSGGGDPSQPPTGTNPTHPGPPEQVDPINQRYQMNNGGPEGG
jgi:hypothetical protein